MPTNRPPTKRRRKVPTKFTDEVRRRFIEYDEVPASLLRFLEAANRH